MASPSCRAQCRAWIGKQIEGQASVSLPDLAGRATEHFSADMDFIRRFMAEMFLPMAYEAAQNTVAATRGATHMLGDEIVDEATFDKRAARLASRWLGWMEHVGDRHLRLAEMRKADLLAAAVEREERGHLELRVANMWREMAGRMDETQTVADAFPDQQLAEISRVLQQFKEAA